MELEEAFHFLEPISQQHVLKYWGQLTAIQRLQLLEQVEALDFSLFKTHRELLLNGPPSPSGEVRPLQQVLRVDENKDVEAGLALMREGRVGCLVVAGGQGTRLQFEGPKALFPTSPIQKKSLLQLLCEKVLAASHQAERPLMLAIMTAPQNHEEVLAYIEENHAFGLDIDQVSFFCQESQPLLTSDGDLFLDRPYRISEGPDGNGGSLKAFVESGVWERWRSRGIEYMNWIPIDNPLAAPFDPGLVGLHDRQNCEVLVKSCPRRNAEESVGVLVEHEGRVRVVEYSELSPDLRMARDSNDQLAFPVANISLFSFSMEFVRRAVDRDLPWHLAHKTASFLDEEGESCQPQAPNAWKFEQFIFDHLPFAEKVGVATYPRYQCFAPLKNLSGLDSLTTVQAALQDYESELFSEVTGSPPPARPFELDPAFYYPPQWLKEKWQGGKAEKGGYVVA